MKIQCNELQRSRLQTLLTEIGPIMLAKTGEILHQYSDYCGLPMCIAGEACSLPRFTRQGLTIKRAVPYRWYNITHRGFKGPAALNEFFGEGAFNTMFSINRTPCISDSEVIAIRFNDQIAAGNNVVENVRLKMYFELQLVYAKWVLKSVR